MLSRLIVALGIALLLGLYAAGPSRKTYCGPYPSLVFDFMCPQQGRTLPATLR